MAECLSPSQDFSVSASDAIDPNTYPSPSASSQSNTCQSRKTVNSKGSSSDACPHNWPDLKLWEAGGTWPGGQVPAAGSAVTIPSNTKVLLTGCSLTNSANTFTSITIPQGSEVGGS